jgi:hypothetical protein
MAVRAKLTHTKEHACFVTLKLCLDAIVVMSGVFETAGLALAIPGIIDVIIRGGEVVYRKVETFRTKHETLIRYLSLAWTSSWLKGS